MSGNNESLLSRVHKLLQSLITSISSNSIKSCISLGVYTFIGIIFLNFLHHVASISYQELNLPFPHEIWSIDEVIKIGLIHGVLSSFFVVLITNWYGLKKKDILTSMVLNGTSLFIINTVGLLPFKSPKAILGIFGMSELSLLTAVVLCWTYSLSIRYLPLKSKKQPYLEMIHRRYLEMYHLVFSAIPVIISGALIAIVILPFQIYPYEIVSSEVFIRFLGIHSLFAVYILLGFWVGVLYQILKKCEIIENSLRP